jgi:hypothetical protein
VSLQVRAAADGELSRHWPEANGRCLATSGREADRFCVVELRAALDAGEDGRRVRGDRRRRLAIRLATPRRSRRDTVPSRPSTVARTNPPDALIASTQPPGEATRLDEFRALPRSCSSGSLAGRRHEPRRGASTGGAVALPARAFRFEAAPRRAQRSWGNWPLRASVLRRGGAEAREALHRDLVALADGAEATPASTAVRRALVEVLRDGDRSAVVARLDRVLLGVATPGRLRAAS